MISWIIIGVAAVAIGVYYHTELSAYGLRLKLWAQSKVHGENDPK